jgi:uncharacterized membrane protein YcaP (DUF421 family)
MLWNIDWQGIFTPQYSLLEMVVRGTIMYAILFVFMRIVLKRQSGGIGTTDILVVVLLAEVTGNAFSTDAKSVVEGGVLVATIVFWSYVVEWMTHRFPVVEQFLHSPPLLLIENGKMLRRNTKAELITEGELMAQLREEGIDDIALVKRACMEADGMISIIKVQP